MRSTVYENLLKIGRNLKNSEAEAAIVREAIQKNNASDLYLSIKNYQTKLGLSWLIHNEKYNQEVFEIKGPMGRGINIQPKGKHIAYTAGTGALVFLDLVAYLLIRVIEANGGPKIVQDAKQGVNNSTFQQSSILSEDNGLVSL